MKTMDPGIPQKPSGENASGYESWLFDKVSETLKRVASGTTELHEHLDAMALVKGQLKTRHRFGTNLGGYVTPT